MSHSIFPNDLFPDDLFVIPQKIKIENAVRDLIQSTSLFTTAAQNVAMAPLDSLSLLRRGLLVRSHHFKAYIESPDIVCMEDLDRGFVRAVELYHDIEDTYFELHRKQEDSFSLFHSLMTWAELRVRRMHLIQSMLDLGGCLA